MQIYYNIIMIIAPETEIYLLKAPLEADEMHQLDFVNAEAQVNYFQSLPKLALMNATYQRENGVMYSIQINGSMPLLQVLNTKATQQQV